MVDDEPAIRELMKLRLEDAGFEVITAVDGRDGLERYKENKDLVQVVVTDLEMPTMSGADMLRQIFKITPAMKVIVASGQLLSAPRQGQSARKGVRLRNSRGRLNLIPTWWCWANGRIGS